MENKDKLWLIQLLINTSNHALDAYFEMYAREEDIAQSMIVVNRAKQHRHVYLNKDLYIQTLRYTFINQVITQPTEEQQVEMYELIKAFYDVTDYARRPNKQFRIIEQQDLLEPIKRATKNAESDAQTILEEVEEYLSNASYVPGNQALYSLKQACANIMKSSNGSKSEPKDYNLPCCLEEIDDEGKEKYDIAFESKRATTTIMIDRTMSNKLNNGFDKMLSITLEQAIKQRYKMDEEGLWIKLYPEDIINKHICKLKQDACKKIESFFNNQFSSKIISTYEIGKRTYTFEGVIFSALEKVEESYGKKAEEGCEKKEKKRVLYYNLQMQPKVLNYMSQSFFERPEWLFELSDESYRIAEHIFYLARQNIDHIKDNRLVFRISIDSLRTIRGLPDKEHANRQESQVIVKPISNNILEMQKLIKKQPKYNKNMLLKYVDKDGKLLTRDSTSEQFLNSYLEITIQNEPLEYLKRFKQNVNKKYKNDKNCKK